jgi:hypothetical protein
MRRNARAYALYREAADAFTLETERDRTTEKRRRRRHRRTPTARAAYDPLERLEKRKLVQRVRGLEEELAVERKHRATQAYDEQTLLARIVRLETEIILLRNDRGCLG